MSEQDNSRTCTGASAPLLASRHLGVHANETPPSGRAAGPSVFRPPRDCSRAKVATAAMRSSANGSAYAVTPPRFDPNSPTQKRPSAEIEHDSGACHAEAISDRAPGSIHRGPRDGRLARLLWHCLTESTEETASRSHPFPPGAPARTQCRRGIWPPRALCEARPRGFEPLTFGSAEGGPSGPVCRAFIENSLHSRGFRRGHERTARAMRRRDLLPAGSHPCSHRSPDRSRASASGAVCGEVGEPGHAERGAAEGAVASNGLSNRPRNSPMAKPNRAGITIRVSGVRVPPSALTK